MSAGADPRSRRPFDDMAFVVGPIRGARALLACIDDSGRPVERRFKADLEETGFFTSHLPRLMTRAETRRNPRSDDSLDDNCDDSCCPSDAAYTTICGRPCLVTACARS